MTRIAFFTQDLIGDALVWANMPKAAAEIFAPCEVTVFCTKGVAELFRCMAFCDKVVSYDPNVPWGAEEAHGFGHFDVVLNTRYDADSIVRVEVLDHGVVYGFENVDIPEAVCKRVYTDYVPLTRWDDYHLRRETSVTEQGAELIRLFAPDYHCEFVRFAKGEFAMELPKRSEGKRIVLVPGASDPKKSWGLNNFLELAGLFAKNGRLPFFLLGPKEGWMAPHVSTTGFGYGQNLPFKQVAGYFVEESGTACTIGNDTGLMHLACSLDAPSITIMPFGTNFTWFPYSSENQARHLFCAPNCAAPMCLMQCLDLASCPAKITIDNILDKYRDIENL